MTHTPIVWLEEVQSTNTEAMRRALDGEPGPLWIAAHRQSAGRGRSGRVWESGQGNLQASLLISIALPAPKAYQLSLVAGVAAHAAIHAAMQPAPAALRLKWPNDVLIGLEKTGGILVETSTAKTGVLSAAIGIGINLASHPGELDRPATHLGAFAHPPSPDVLIEHLATAMDHWLAVWNAGTGFSSIREAWLDAAHPIGERLSIKAGSAAIAGTFAGLDQDGALLLDVSDGQRRTFTYGDVSLGV